MVKSALRAPTGGMRIGGKTYRGGQMVPERYRQQVERVRDPAAGTEQPPNMGRYALPHVITFQGILTTLSKAYRNSDEALRHSVENAHMMINDPMIMGPLLARQRMVSLLNWSVESEDQKDPKLKAIADEIGTMLTKMPRFTEYRRCLSEAIWYGRYACQHAWRVMRTRDGQRRWTVANWIPVSGDKLLFRFDDGSGKFDPNQVGVKVSAALAKNDVIAGNRVLEATGEGLGYFLQPWERSLMAIHRHMVRDGEFEDPITGSQIHGVGLRNFLYWTWYQKQEALAQLAELVERTGMGFTIYYYPSGNPQAREEIEKVAREQAHTNVILMPHEEAAPDATRVEQIPPNTAGLEILFRIIEDFYGEQIIRFILGQTLSTKAAATGLGSGVANLHQDSLYQIVRYDAVNLEETITRELVMPMVAFNWPKYRNVDFSFRISTKATIPEEELNSIRSAWEMGLAIKASDVLDVIGLAAPTDDDEKLVNPQILAQIKQLTEPQPIQPPGGMPPGPGGPTPGGPEGGMGPDDDGQGDPAGLPPGPDDAAPPEGEGPEKLSERDERAKLFGPILNRKAGQPQRYSGQWDESQHPRGPDGRWVTADSLNAMANGARAGEWEKQEFHGVPVWVRGSRALTSAQLLEEHPEDAAQAGGGQQDDAQQSPQQAPRRTPPGEVEGDNSTLELVAGMFGLNEMDRQDPGRAGQFLNMAARRLGYQPQGETREERYQDAAEFLAGKEDHLNAVVEFAAAQGYRPRSPNLATKSTRAAQFLIDKAEQEGHTNRGNNAQERLASAMGFLDRQQPQQQQSHGDALSRLLGRFGTGPISFWHIAGAVVGFAAVSTLLRGWNRRRYRKPLTLPVAGSSQRFAPIRYSVDRSGRAWQYAKDDGEDDAKEKDGPQWLTIGGGARVMVDDDGEILMGCPGLEGENVDEIGEGEDPQNREERDQRQEQAEQQGWEGSETQDARGVWEQAKQHSPDHVCIVEIGDKCYAFDDDAAVLQQSINVGDGKTAEFDRDKLEGHVQTLVGDGHRVAVVGRDESGELDEVDRQEEPAAQVQSSKSESSSPEERNGLTEKSLFSRSGEQFSNLQRALGVAKPVMGPKGVSAIQRGLSRIPGGNVIKALLAVDGSQAGYDRNGFADRGMEAFADAIGGRFPQSDLDAAKQWLETTFSNSKELGHINQNRWLAGVVRTAEPSPEDAQEEPAPPEPSTEEPAESHADKLPEGIRSTVERQLDTLRDAADRLQKGRELDQRLGSDGRYEFETWQKLQGQLQSARETLDEFRKRAPGNDIDADRVFSEMGGLPDVALSDAARGWTDEESTPEQVAEPPAEPKPRRKWKTPEHSSVEMVNRAFARNLDRVMADPEAAANQDLIRARGALSSIQAHHGRQVQRGEITREQAATLQAGVQTEIDNIGRILREREQNGDPGPEVESEAEMIARAVVHDGRNLHDVARDMGLSLQERREMMPDIEAALAAERELIGEDGPGDAPGAEDAAARAAAGESVNRPPGISEARWNAMQRAKGGGQPQAATGPAATAPGPIGGLMDSLAKTRDARKTGSVKTDQLTDDYAKSMHDHLRSIQRDGDGFGDVYDLSEELGPGALGYHSPAGVLALVPPKFKGDSWEARWSKTNSNVPQTDANQESGEGSQPVGPLDVTEPNVDQGQPAGDANVPQTDSNGPLENVSQELRTRHAKLSQRAAQLQAKIDKIDAWQGSSDSSRAGDHFHLGYLDSGKATSSAEQKRRGRDLDKTIDNAKARIEAQQQLNAAKAEIGRIEDGTETRREQQAAANREKKAAAKPLGQDHGRKIAQNISMEGKHTLADGSVLSTEGGWDDDKGDLYGRAVITTPDGRRIEGPDTGTVQGGALTKAAQQLAKEYLAGKHAALEPPGSDGAEPAAGGIGEVPEADFGNTPEPQETPAATSAPQQWDPEQHGGYKPLLALGKRVAEGDIDPQEFKDSFEFYAKNRDAMVQDLAKRFNAKQLTNIAGNLGDLSARRNSKAQNAASVYSRLMLNAFHHDDGGFSYSPFQVGGGMVDMQTARENALRDYVQKQTPESMQEIAGNYASKRQQRDEAAAQKEAAIANPQSLDDYRRYAEHRGGFDQMEPEHQRRYDELAAEESRQKRQEQQAKKATVEQLSTDAGGFDTSTNYHSKRGQDIYTASPRERVDREGFNEMNRKAKQLGGWYYKAFRGTPGGFHFPTEEARAKFLALTEGSVDNSQKVATDAQEKSQTTAGRMAEMADRLQAAGEASLGQDRRTNTARRAGMAASAEADARAQIAKAQTMRNIAQAIESGEAKYLEGVSAGTQLDTLDSVLRRSRWDKYRKQNVSYADQQKRDGEPFGEEDIQHATYPYPTIPKRDMLQLAAAAKGKRGIKFDRAFMERLAKSAGDDGYVKIRTPGQWESFKAVVSKLKQTDPGTHKWLLEGLDRNSASFKRLQAAGITNEHELRQALREYVPIRGKQAAADPVKTAERSLIGKKLPGFFPTPPPVVDRMLAEADIRPGQSVLEPSAGKGDILDAIKEAHPEAQRHAIEQNRTLQDVLNAKGHEVQYGDFLDHQGQYDRVVMNPPFENRQDAAHVRHAFNQLKPGGKLVAVMSSGTLSGSDRKAQEFQQWLESVGGTAEPLPAGAFAGNDAFRQTGVNTHLVVISR